MGEWYWGDAEVQFPASIPKTVIADDFDAETWVCEHLSTECADDTPEGERLLALLSSIQSWLADAEVITIGHAEDGSWQLSIGGEKSYGCAWFYTDTDIEQVCQANGFAYRLFDEGKYEIPGEERVWKPGMEDSFYRDHSQAGTVLAESTVAAWLIEADGDVAALGQRVVDYFAIPVPVG